MTNTNDSGEFTIGLTVGTDPARPGASLDFVGGTMKVLGRTHGDRIVNYAMFNAWLPLLGRIESEYKALAEVPKPRRKRRDRSPQNG